MLVTNSTPEELADAVVTSPLDSDLRIRFRDMVEMQLADLFSKEIEMGKVLRASLPDLGDFNV